MLRDDPLDQLPPTLPPELRAFLECTGDAATIANGPIQWLEIPANARGLLGGASQAALEAKPGPAPGSALLTVRAGWVSATLAATVVEGRLTIDRLKLPMFAPRSIASGVEQFVDALNSRLAANGKALATPTFGADGMTLTKIDRVG